ncbi:hypothetical protein SLEP1_g14172 [Rubroshorea leprosula]|uniref:Leucine-rich repeat-containing N-terminal plant-type domain-containing protein n=1 Tax=Rubroshorea leprosula TaxID=152421 RepID=A0AAV5II45_9ROSI|nr:hypothetical protein SLEP1_g14172 [Rubroshorea leprosula]
MGAFSCFFASLLLFTSLNFHPGLCWEAEDGGGDVVTRTGREATEMLVGGGGAPPAPSSLPPSEPLHPQQAKPIFENALLQRDYFTIQRFAKRIQSDPQGYKKTWVGTNICKYRGFTCERLPYGARLNALAAVDFNGANFDGPNLRLDDFLEKLNETAIFHANSNNFKGTVPQNVSKLPYLYELDLSNNKLSGVFPTEVVKSTKLTFVDLRFNNFRGGVPGTAFNLDVDVFFINNNGFTTLPRNIGSTAALFLTFANNKFSGTIPSSIGSARNLREILFLGNNLSGCLPHQIGFLNKSTVFDVSGNNLTGPIPQSFACLLKMELLNLASNQFYGRVPEIVCRLPNIARLTLANNYFTQVGPYCRRLINLGKLDIRNNCVSGLPAQRSGAECAAFFSQRRRCTNERLMRRIPCQRTLMSLNITDTNWEEKEHIGPVAATYGTLVPHGP